MNRATYVISRFYVNLVLRNSITIFALTGMIAYSLLTSIDDIAILQHNGVQLNVIEVVFSIFNNQRYTTYGLFFPFLFVIFPMFYAKDLERLIACRTFYRSDFWTAKVLAIIQITFIFLGIAFLIVLTSAMLNFPFSLEWSDAYGQYIRKDTDVIGLCGFEYLYREYNPLSVTVLQALLFLISFILVGVLSAFLVQIIDRQMIAFIAVSLYWIVALVGYMLPPTLVFLSPATHLLLSGRTPEFPFIVSFFYFVSVLTLLTIFGSLKAQKAVLGV